MTRLAHISLLTIALLLWHTSQAQMLRYNIYLLGKKIGETTIERKDSSGLSHYILRSSTDVKMLFIEKKNSLTADVYFNKEGKLTASTCLNVKDGEQDLTNAKWNNNKLVIDKNGNKTETLQSVDFTSLLLYFTEPKDLQKVFSERLGKFYEMIKQDNGKYMAVMDGHTDQYSYTNGKLTELEIKSTLGSVQMKLVP